LTSRRTSLAIGGGAAAIAAAVHFGPAITSVMGLRRTVLRGIGGVGRPDHVALTFDDGPDPASTPAVMAELDRLGWRATFFLLAPNARAAPGLVRQLVAAGHEVGVHGERHRSHLTRHGLDSLADIRRGRDTVAELAGVSPQWFRPPYGALSAGALLAARQLGLRTVLWTTWGRDWRAEATPSSVAADVLGGLAPGGCVLLHDSDCTSAPGSWRSGLGALPLLADAFAERGLSVGPLGEHDVRPSSVFWPVGAA